MRPFTISSSYDPGLVKVYFLTVLYISLVIPLTQASSHAVLNVERSLPSSGQFFPSTLSSNFYCSMNSSLSLWFLKIFIFSLLHHSLVPQSSAFTSFVSSYVVQRLSSLGLGTTVLHMCLICSDLWLLFILEEELKPHLTKLQTGAPSFCSHSCFFIHWD